MRSPNRFSKGGGNQQQCVALWADKLVIRGQRPRRAPTCVAAMCCVSPNFHYYFTHALHVALVIP